MSDEIDRIEVFITALMKPVLTQMTDLSKSVDTLVKAETARGEREKAQEKVNVRIDEFMQVYRPTLDRTARFHIMLDKALVPVISLIIIAAFILLGVDLKR